MLAVALDLTVGDVQLPKGTRVIAGRILRIALLVGMSWKRRGESVLRCGVHAVDG